MSPVKYWIFLSAFIKFRSEEKLNAVVTKMTALDGYLLDLIFKRVIFNLEIFSTGKINDQNSTALKINGNEIFVNLHRTKQIVFVDPARFSEG